MISATYEWAFDPKTPDEAFVELAKAHACGAVII